MEVGYINYIKINKISTVFSSYFLVFGSALPLEFFEQWCQDAFGPEFTHNMLENSIAASNIEYGGFEPGSVIH